MSARAAAKNLLVVSDLHFGEELLPGASVERRRAVELAATAFREFLRHHAARRRDGRPWRLVVAGDLFDFMSVVVPGAGAQSSDVRRFGLVRGGAASVVRMREIGRAHQATFVELVRFVAAGHEVDLIAGNHDIELQDAAVEAELRHQLRLAGAGDRELARIRVSPWFVNVPGVAWIEHGHVYDEACSFEFNLSPGDPVGGEVLVNPDYAAIRYLGTTLPEVDPSAIEEWSFWGFINFGWSQGVRSFSRILGAYALFVASLLTARTKHQSLKLRDRRRRVHRERLAAVAAHEGMTMETLQGVDRLARTPLTVSWRRLGRMLMLDKFAIAGTALLAIVVLLALLPLGWALGGAAVAVAGAAAAQAALGKHMVSSQLPMRAVPRRLGELVRAPVVVFGHTHDPRRQRAGEVLYINSGTWLPATKPGLRRSFTHVLIQPRPGREPDVELRQWRDAGSLPFHTEDEVDSGSFVTVEQAAAG
jgi:UDP-2,3-diacylglucosamine pyrophosphatase LpxH